MKTGKLGRWGNQIGFVLLPFKIGLKTNPLDYVKEAKAVIDRKKASFEPLYTYFIVYFVLKLFGIKVNILLYNEKIKDHQVSVYDCILY